MWWKGARQTQEIVNKEAKSARISAAQFLNKNVQALTLQFVSQLMSKNVRFNMRQFMRRFVKEHQHLNVQQSRSKNVQQFRNRSATPYRQSSLRDFCEMESLTENTYNIHSSIALVVYKYICMCQKHIAIQGHDNVDVTIKLK